MNTKQLALIALGSTTLFLTACGTQTPVDENLQDDTEQTQQIEQNTGEDETTLLSNTSSTMTCPEAVQNYLDAASLTGEGTQTVKSGDNIIVDYIGRLADGTVFDTSVESVAKACNTYTPERSYTEGLSFSAGAGQMIAGFDAGVLGMKIGQTKTINIPAKDAYGERSEENIVTYPLSEAQELADAKVGDKIPTMYGTLTVVSKTDTEITLDFNHPLAGKDLIFDITIKAIN